MPRASREQQAVHRAQILERASHLVRERGANGFSVPELMAEVGLTHGGFYKHFESKEDLLVQASDAAFSARAKYLSQLRLEEPVKAAARIRFVNDYLSTGHRDNVAEGCAGAALAVEVGRQRSSSPLRQSYLGGVSAMMESLSGLQRESGDEPGLSSPDPKVLADFATLVGAILLARATADDDLSEQILAAARDELLKTRVGS